jgi:lipoate-protein ligase B
VEDVLILLEHPHVITLGVRGDGGRSHILASLAQLAARGIQIHETGRGGDITYHGPGQIVGYPIVDLAGLPGGRDLHRYLRDLEEALIRTLATYGLTAERRPPYTGVWVGREKLAAIGVRIARWVTSHGFALNVGTDLVLQAHPPVRSCRPGVTSPSGCSGGSSIETRSRSGDPAHLRRLRRVAASSAATDLLVR